MSSQITMSSGSSARSTPSRVVSFSPASARRTTSGAGDPVGVEGVHRLAQLEHHVVGDVDGQRDAADAGGDRAAAASTPGGRGRVDAAHQPGREPVAADRVVDLHRVRRRLGAARAPAPGPGRGTARRSACDSSRARPRTDSAYPRSGVISSSTTTSSRPTTGRASSPGLAVTSGRQHDDAGVVVAEAQLAGRADHAVGDVPVRLAGADREAAGQHAAGQDHHDQVAGGEVASPRRRSPAARRCRWRHRRRPGRTGSAS